MTTETPPQAPTSAMTVAEKEVAVDRILMENVIRSVGTLDEGRLQRWVVSVTLTPKHQYLIKGASRKVGGRDDGDDDEGGGTWVSDWSAAPRAEGYDWLNRVAGIRFWTPPTVHNRAGGEVPNPIHSRDYLYHREVGIGYSEIGQMVVQVEDIEIDFQMAWEAVRLAKFKRLPAVKKRDNSSTDLLVRDPDGLPKLSATGQLLFRLPDKMEAEAAERLITLRNFGGRQAKTIARRRILQTMTGIRTLWTVTQAERPELRPISVLITGWRDDLKPEAALEKARAEAKVVFGAEVRERDPEVAATPEEIEDAAFTEAEAPGDAEAEIGEVTEERRQELLRSAKAGVVPGVTVGMPGEKLKNAICGAMNPTMGPNVCTKKPGHEPTPHENDQGVWPSVVA